MTQVGEGQEAEESAPQVMTFGAPTAGEILAERYELVEHINNDSAGRLVWRGVDVILRRPVAVVLRYPGGDSATEMLQGAVAASRVIHPNLVGVYDAIDEAERAYVVREWVDGQSLRELVTDGPMDPARATTIGNAVASALAAVHATGMVHGNVHPGTVMISDDGRVVLADARTDGADSQQSDVRAIGGVLYFALTGHWPHAEAPLRGATAGHGRAAIPDAVRDAAGAIAAPGRCGRACRRTSTTSPWTCWTPRSSRPRRTCSRPSWPGWTCRPTSSSSTAPARCASRPTPARSRRRSPPPADARSRSASPACWRSRWSAC